MKRIGRVLVIICIVVTMATMLFGCKAIKNGIYKQVEDSTNVEDGSNETGIESEQKEVENAARYLIDAAIKGEYIADLVVNKEVGDIVYEESKLAEAMGKGENVWILVKSSEINIDSIKKIEKGIYEIGVSNDISDTAILNMIDVEGKWKLDISELGGDLYIEVPKGVTISVDGVEVSKEYIEATDKHDIYRIPNMLDGTVSRVSYDTGLTEKFDADALVGTNEPNKMIYKLTDADLEILIPEAENLWRSVRECALNEDIAGIDKLIAGKSMVDAENILNALSNDNFGTKLQGFIKRTDEDAEADGCISQMDAVGTYTLHLLGKFSMPDFITGPENPSSYCWVQIIKEDNEYKILDVSKEVWMDEMNIFDNDK